VNGIAKKARRHGQLRIRGGSYQAESRAPHSVLLTAHARPSPEPLTNPPFHSPQFTGCRPPQRRVLYRRITARSSTRAAAATATATNNSRVLPKVSFSPLPDPPPLHLFSAPDLAAAGRQFLRGQPRAEPAWTMATARLTAALTRAPLPPPCSRALCSAAPLGAELDAAVRVAAAPRGDGSSRPRRDPHAGEAVRQVGACGHVGKAGSAKSMARVGFPLPGTCRSRSIGALLSLPLQGA